MRNRAYGGQKLGIWVNFGATVCEVSEQGDGEEEKQRGFLILELHALIPAVG